MKKVIFGIFAHPDDEAFGPAGALLVEKAAGNEVHLICTTGGENGTNPDNLESLGETRLAEWRHAGELLGADSMNHLGYTDGTLCNNNYMEIAGKITEIVNAVINSRDDIEIEFMSLDLNGLTGHLDHVTIGRIACYVFYSLKTDDARFSRIRLACLAREDVPETSLEWLYMEAGRLPSEIGETVDATAHLEKITQIMRAHHTQRGDRESIVAKLGDRIALNHFIVLD